MAKSGKRQSRRPKSGNPAKKLGRERQKRPVAPASQVTDLSNSWLHTMTSRRNLLMGGATLGAILAGGALLWPKAADEDVTLQVLPDSEIKIKWQDVFDLQVSNAELKKHVTGFMDLFEKSVFKFYLQDAQTGVVTENYITGQQVLGDIQRTNEEYERTGFRYQTGIQYLIPNGKIVIASHDNLFKGVATGSNTMFSVNEGREAPLRINLGTDYLKGARYYGVPGSGWFGIGRATHPATLENVLSNEIGHVWYRTSNEKISNGIENIIAVQMGAPQRDMDKQEIEFSRNSNGGFVTLYDGVRLIEGPLPDGRSPSMPDFRVAPR